MCVAGYVATLVTAMLLQPAPPPLFLRQRLNSVNSYEVPLLDYFVPFNARNLA
jgi:hypothetical protein